MHNYLSWIFSHLSITNPTRFQPPFLPFSVLKTSKYIRTVARISIFNSLGFGQIVLISTSLIAQQTKNEASKGYSCRSFSSRTFFSPRILDTRRVILESTQIEKHTAFVMRVLLLVKFFMLLYKLIAVTGTLLF